MATARSPSDKRMDSQIASNASTTESPAAPGQRQTDRTDYRTLRHRHRTQQHKASARTGSAVCRKQNRPCRIRPRSIRQRVGSSRVFMWSRSSRGFAPHARQPRLLFARQPRRAVIVIDFNKSRSRHLQAPGLEIMISPVTTVAPAFLVCAAGIGTEQDTAVFQRGMQLTQHPRQLLRRDMKQRGIGKYAVEARIRKVELKKILLPHLASRFRPRHFGEAPRALQPNRVMPETGKRFQVASRPAAEIEDRKGWHRFDAIQQCRNVLADVVIAGAVAKCFGALVVVLQCERGYFSEVLRFSLHSGCRTIIQRNEWPTWLVCKGLSRDECPQLETMDG